MSVREIPFHKYRAMNLMRTIEIYRREVDRARHGLPPADPFIAQYLSNKSDRVEFLEERIGEFTAAYIKALDQ